MAQKRSKPQPEADEAVAARGRPDHTPAARDGSWG
jgi:hypothetical protein